MDNATLMTTSSGSGDSPPTSGGGQRVRPNQWRAFGGVWRLTAWQFLSRNHLLTVASMTALLAGIAMTAAPGVPEGYAAWIVNFYLSVLVPVLAFLSGAGAMRDAMKAGSADYVFTRPVRRWAYVGFKYVAHTACTVVTWLPAFAVIVVTSSSRQLPDMGMHFPHLLVAQTLTLAAFVGLGFLCAVLTRRYLIIGLVYAGIIEVGIGNIPAPLSGLSIMQHVRELLHPLLDSGQRGVSFLEAVATGGTVFLFCAAFVGLAALLFSMQELAGERAGD